MKKSDMKKRSLPMAAKVLLYAACAILIIYYCLVLWWGFVPNVGVEYKMYYITHELSDWCGYGNLKYSYGTQELCITRNEETIAQTDGVICARKGQGFGESTMAGTKVSDENSYVYYLPETDAANAKISVNVTDFDGNGVNVYAGDTLVGSFVGAGTHTFDISGVKGGEVLKIRFENGKSSYTLYSLKLDS